MHRISRPSPATLIAFVALFVALGGPSQAAQLARKVTHHHGHSLRGPRGPRGSFAKPIRVIARIDPNGGRAVVQCPPRSIATGGGVSSDPGLFVQSSVPVPPQGWTGAVANPPGGGAALGGVVVAVCVPTS